MCIFAVFYLACAFLSTGFGVDSILAPIDDRVISIIIFFSPHRGTLSSGIPRPVITSNDSIWPLFTIWYCLSSFLPPEVLITVAFHALSLFLMTLCSPYLWEDIICPLSPLFPHGGVSGSDIPCSVIAFDMWCLGGPLLALGGRVVCWCSMSAAWSTTLPTSPIMQRPVPMHSAYVQIIRVKRGLVHYFAYKPHKAAVSFGALRACAN